MKSTTVTLSVDACLDVDRVSTGNRIFISNNTTVVHGMVMVLYNSINSINVGIK